MGILGTQQVTTLASQTQGTLHLEKLCSALVESLPGSSPPALAFFSNTFKHLITSSNFENQLRGLGVWQSEPGAAPRWLAAGAKSCKPGPGNGRKELCLEMSGAYEIHHSRITTKYNVVRCISIFQSYINDIIVVFTL